MRLDVVWKTKKWFDEDIIIISWGVIYIWIMLLWLCLRLKRGTNAIFFWSYSSGFFSSIKTSIFFFVQTFIRHLASTFFDRILCWDQMITYIYCNKKKIFRQLSWSSSNPKNSEFRVNEIPCWTKNFVGLKLCFLLFSLFLSLFLKRGLKWSILDFFCSPYDIELLFKIINNSLIWDRIYE